MSELNKQERRYSNLMNLLIIAGWWR